MSGWMDYFRRGGSRYTALATNETSGQGHAEDPDPERQTGHYERTRRALRATGVALVLLTVGSLAVAFL